MVLKNVGTEHWVALKPKSCEAVSQLLSARPDGLDCESSHGGPTLKAAALLVKGTNSLSIS